MDRITHKVLGYEVDILTFDEAISKALDSVKNKIGMQVVTINPEIIKLANTNYEYSQIIKNAELVLPDGSGIKFALKLKGIIQEQIPGIDFTKKLLQKCCENDFSVALIGAKEEVICKAITNLKSEMPKLNICYFKNGYFNKDEDASVIKEMTDKQPALVLVALGAPKQELFINECRKVYDKAVYIGVGGSFDVWAGNVQRAPEIFRKFGCEWLYRTIKQPQRIKRIYKTLPMFLIKAIIESKRK